MKTVVITGANGNLGAVVTSLFLSRGYRVLAVVGSADSLTRLPSHENLEGFSVDLTQEDPTRKFVQSAITKHQRIDGAILLAGGFAMGKISTTSLEDVKKQLAINFDTAYTVTRPLFDHMLANNAGRIVFMGARPALVPEQGFGNVAYSLSKTMLIKLAEYLNAEAVGRNVTATVVVPSTINTLANRNSMPKADFSKWVDPAQIAGVLEFVLSDSGSSLRDAVLKVYGNA
jgi:NAD(P)-dependent dehydrogenase (short-subunit alcohol dehydrogenase family)